MEDGSVFELYSRARKVGERKVAEAMYALALIRATEDPNTDLFVLIRATDPEGYKVRARDDDKFYIVNPGTNAKIGMRKSRLSRRWADNCYLIAKKVESFNAPRGTFQPIEQAPAHVLERLRADARKLTSGRERRIAEVFGDEVSRSATNGQRPPVSYGQGFPAA
jgi:hypothetical protein